MKKQYFSDRKRDDARKFFSKYFVANVAYKFSKAKPNQKN
jgi:hypothetical protein